MRNLPTLLAATLVIVIVGFYMCTYQVRFTEVAIEETFGRPSETPTTEPGLYMKWPWPIQNVVKFDRRIRVLEDRTEETYTAEGKNIILTTSTLWAIKDPYKFHLRFPEIADGERNLRDAIRSQKKAVVGQYNLSDFVSTNPQERKLREIEQEMIGQVRDEALGDTDGGGARSIGNVSLRELWDREYGVDLKYFGITKLTLPQSVTQAIFDRMKEGQQTRANKYVAEGKAEAEQIVASAYETKERIMAVAIRRADEIRNEGEKIVSELYAGFEEHQDLRIFLDKIRTLEEAFSDNTTFVLDSGFPPIDLFQEGASEEITEPDLDKLNTRVMGTGTSK